MLAAARGRPYDAVVLDSDMPELQRRRGRSRDPRGARAADRPDRDADLGRRAGRRATRTRFLTKPVRRAALLEALADVLADDRARARTSVADEPPPVATRGRVLVAEDNPVNQLVIETLLRRRGFDVDVVADGLEAVERLDPEAP